MFFSLLAASRDRDSGQGVVLGLEGEAPEAVDTDTGGPRVARIRADRRLSLLGAQEIDFDPDRDLVLHRRRSLPYHPNGMVFTAYDVDGADAREHVQLARRRVHVGQDGGRGGQGIVPHPSRAPYLLRSGGGAGGPGRQRAFRAPGGPPHNCSPRCKGGERAGGLRVSRAMLGGVGGGAGAATSPIGGPAARGGAGELRRSGQGDSRTAEADRAVDLFTLAVMADNEDNGRVVAADKPPSKGSSRMICASPPD